MAYHYSGNQYELAYKPPALRNWEVPKYYSHPAKPKTRAGSTRVIANDRGHILPGVPKSKENPWGDFIPTWHMPNKIDRKTADELNGLYKFRKPTCKERLILQKTEEEHQQAQAARLKELEEEAAQNEAKLQEEAKAKSEAKSDEQTEEKAEEAPDDGKFKCDEDEDEQAAAAEPEVKICPIHGVIVP